MRRLAAVLLGAVIVLGGTSSHAVAAPGDQTTVVGSWAENGNQSIATCPAGTKLVSGGYNAQPNYHEVRRGGVLGMVVDATDGVRSSIGPNMISTNTPAQNSWYASIEDGRIRAYAICEEVAPRR